MHCSRVRTAVSARLDGEQLPPGVTGGLLDAHLAGCSDCRLWSERAARLQHLTSEARSAHSGGGSAALDGLLDRLRRSAAQDRDHHQ
ncbi:zf-HC2 domain-containing protein [Streptomyces sp. NPDC052496]|uniref:zf-HC2 domain-containing protein n=1 Tax=Streptomyces sp. NPDC052496 TaxID=3154951 RepID=UPI003413167B